MREELSHAGVLTCELSLAYRNTSICSIKTPTFFLSKYLFMCTIWTRVKALLSCHSIDQKRKEMFQFLGPQSKTLLPYQKYMYYYIQ